MEGRVGHRTSCDARHQRHSGFESIPRLEGADNQSPMKQDNRDHWTLFSANLQHLFQLPPTTSTLQPLHTSLKNICPSWVPPKNLSEHLLEEVNWLFCRRLSALSFPPPTSYSSPTQSTLGNVVNFCYDRLRDNPTIAKHFVYLSHSHKSSRILKQKKEKYSGLVVFRSQQRCDSAPTGSILR